MNNMSREDALEINRKYIKRDFPDSQKFTLPQPKTQPSRKGAYIVTEDYHVKDDELGFDFVIPKGWEYDGASIPRFWWRVIGSPFLAEFQGGCLPHDYLYRMLICERKLADQLMKKRLLLSDVSKARAGLMYRAVRIGGGSRWRENRDTLH